MYSEYYGKLHASFYRRRTSRFHLQGIKNLCALDAYICIQHSQRFEGLGKSIRHAEFVKLDNSFTIACMILGIAALVISCTAGTDVRPPCRGFESDDRLTCFAFPHAKDTTSGSPYMWILNNYLYLILNISLVFTTDSILFTSNFKC